jgi:hypothetical protein
MTARPRGRGPLRYLPALTLVAVLTITASAEFELARTVLDLPPYIAWALPVAVDSYVLAALHSGRDVVPALAVMAGSLAASMGAHLAAASGDGPLPGHVVAPAATGIMCVLVVVAWRVHVLIEYAIAPDPPNPVVAQPSTDTPAEVSLLPGALVQAPPALRAAGRHEEPTAPTSLSDAQILAEIGTTPPSIRALKRQYAIGQTRATRIHRTARPTKARGKTQDVIQDELETDQEATSEEGHEESPETTERNTHTCITDRVGPSSPPGADGTGSDGRPYLTSVPDGEVR